MTTVYLIRHAQAEGNLYRRCHGWHNGLITQKGRQQIAALERRFEGVHFDAVYSSDLYRTMTTAGAIYHSHGLPLRTVPALREVHCGCWEGQAWGNVFHSDRAGLAAFLRCDPSWQVEGGETFQQARARMKVTVEALAAAHEGQTIAVVSHGSAIRCGLSAWLGIPMEKLGTLEMGDNTCVAKLEYSGGQMKVVYYNDNSHLGSLAAKRRRTGLGVEGFIADFEAHSLRFEPLWLPEQSGLFLDARKDGWQASFGTLDGFDADSLLGAAQRRSDYAPGSVLLALAGNTPAGVLEMDWQRQAEAGIGWVSLICMRPEFRFKGLGIQLLGQAVSDYRAKGRQFLRLRCAPENAPARKFYADHGFYQAGQEVCGAHLCYIMEKYIGLELR